MKDRLALADLKTVARRYTEDQKKSGAVTSPQITARSPGVVLKQAQELAHEVRRAG
jgi:hypothetical protein